LDEQEKQEMIVYACLVIGAMLLVAIVVFIWKVIKGLANASLRRDLD
jgi:hypothetical protein